MPKMRIVALPVMTHLLGTTRTEEQPGLYLAGARRVGSPNDSLHSGHHGGVRLAAALLLRLEPLHL